MTSVPKICLIFPGINLFHAYMINEILNRETALFEKGDLRIMKYVKVIFSPTGGTAKVADILTGNWDVKETIDLSKADQDFTRYQFDSNDVAVVAMPSFGGLAPQAAIDRFSKISGNGANCIIVTVYGNRAYEDSLVQMQDTAENCGFKVIAAVSAVAEHSIMHQYATGRPDKTDSAKLSEFADRIEVRISEGKDTTPDIPGNRPYKKAGGAGLVPKCTSDCTNCKTCVTACPVQAIDSGNPRITDSKKCISCMRCVSICPSKARKVNGAMVKIASLAIKQACLERKEDELFI